MFLFTASAWEGGGSLITHWENNPLIIKLIDKWYINCLEFLFCRISCYTSCKCAHYLNVFENVSSFILSFRG